MAKTMDGNCVSRRHPMPKRSELLMLCKIMPFRADAIWVTCLPLKANASWCFRVLLPRRMGKNRSLWNRCANALTRSWNTSGNCHAKHRHWPICRPPHHQCQHSHNSSNNHNNIHPRGLFGPWSINNIKPVPRIRPFSSDRPRWKNPIPSFALVPRFEVNNACQRVPGRRVTTVPVCGVARNPKWAYKGIAAQPMNIFCNTLWNAPLPPMRFAMRRQRPYHHRRPPIYHHHHTHPHVCHCHVRN